MRVLLIGPEWDTGQLDRLLRGGAGRRRPPGGLGGSMAVIWRVRLVSEDACAAGSRDRIGFTLDVCLRPCATTTWAR